MRAFCRVALCSGLVAALVPARAAGQAVRSDPYDAPSSPPSPTEPRTDMRHDDVQSLGAGDATPDQRDGDVVPLDQPDLGRRRREDPSATVGAAYVRASTPGEPAARARVRYALDGIEIRGNARTANRVVLRYVRFRAGDVLDVDDPEIELTRYRLLGTGFFSNVQMSLRRGSRRGAAVLVIEVVERNTLVVQNLQLGVAADEDSAGNARPVSAYIGLALAETNLAGTGITLGAGVGLASDQLALRTHFYDPAFLGTLWSARVGLLYADAREFYGNRAVSFESPTLEQRRLGDYAVVGYQRFGASLAVGHDLTVASDLALEYRVEQVDATVPTVASHLRGNVDDEGRDSGVREPIAFAILPGRSVLSVLRASYAYDTRDAPFLTRRGTRAVVSLTAGLPPLGSSYSFQKLELSAQRSWLTPWKHVVRGEVFLGGIAGSPPFFEQFYVGDFSAFLPDRILDLAPDRRRAPNLLDTSIAEVRYGDYAAKLEGEYRVPIYTGRGAVYGVDLFGAASLYAVATRRDLSDPAPGYSGFARVPVDLSFNLGVRVDTSLGGITVAFSNLLGFIPGGRGERK